MNRRRFFIMYIIVLIAALALVLFVDSVRGQQVCEIGQTFINGVCVGSVCDEGEVMTAPNECKSIDEFQAVYIPFAICFMP